MPINNTLATQARGELSRPYLQVTVVLVGQGHLGGVLHLLCVLGKHGLVDLDLWGCKGGGSDEFQSLVADEFSGKPEERLLKVVVGLGGDVVVLEVLLSVEGDGLGLDFALLDIDLVAGKDNGDVLADTDQVTVPVGDVLVCDTRGDVEHDDAALAVDVVSITKTTKLLLTSGVPDVELDGAEVCGEAKRVNFDSERRNVLLLELSGQMALDEGGLSRTTVTDKHKLEGGDVALCGFSHDIDLFCCGGGWFACLLRRTGVGRELVGGGLQESRADVGVDVDVGGGVGADVGVGVPLSSEWGSVGGLDGLFRGARRGFVVQGEVLASGVDPPLGTALCFRALGPIDRSAGREGSSSGSHKHAPWACLVLEKSPAASC